MNQVIVACKIPSGLIIEVGSHENDNYRRVEVAGPNTHLRTGRNTGLMIGGYVFTPVAEDVWNEFAQKHKSAKYFKTRMVFAEDTLDKAHAAALSDKNLKTGFERLNPDKLPEGLEADAEHLKKQKQQAPALNQGRLAE